MANLPQPDTDPRLRNILLLDKSTAPLASQVQEACSILGIQLPLLDHENDQDSQQTTRSGPREEWTLRWLLKKLEGSSPGLQSAYLELDVWLLFQELISRLPAANLARLLRDHGFLDIVLGTLRSMQESMNGYNGRKQRNAGLSSRSMSGESSGAADSSSATVGASVEPSNALKKMSLKDTSVEHSTSRSRWQPDLPRLFRALCVATWRLQQLAQDDSNGYAVEHLKMALRASPEQASDITGMSLRMTDYVFHTGGFVTRYNIFDQMISPWVTIWNCRSRKTTQDTVDLAFAANCFVPALRVLTRLNNSLAPKVDLDKAVGVLEDLLLQHVITPARDTFETWKKTRAGVDDEDLGATIGSLLSPLCNETACQKYHITSWADSVETIHPVAHFYGIAVKHTSLGTSKERIASMPWLQFMFDRLSDQLESQTAAPSQISSKTQNYTLAIKQMLEILVVHKINLGTATLERVLVKVSQILNSKAHQVDWHIVGLCLKIDSDVFVIPNNTDTSKATPNKFLAALFARLNDISDSSHENDETSPLVLREVLVPLVEGFAHARNLIGFITYWKSNLIQQWISATNSGLQPAANGSTKVFSSHIQIAQCIWEREGLIQAVAGLLESHLTDRQIELLLQEANTAVESAKTTSEPTAWLDSSANLVILDCVLSGCTGENTIEQLSMAIQNTYVALLGLRKANGLPITMRWRVWRCIATIKNRCQVDITHIPNLNRLEGVAVEDALKVQTQKDQRKDPKEQFHSFNFLISIIDKNLPLVGKALAGSTVQLVVSLLDRYAELVISHLPDTGSFQILSPSSYDISPENLKLLLAFQESTLRYASVLLKDHLKLLIKFLAYPNKDFNLLKFPSGHPKDSQDQMYEDRKPALLEIAEQVYRCCVHCYVDTEAIELLKLLVQQVLDYQLSSDAGAQAVSYLTSYYESLNSYTRKVALIMRGVQYEDNGKARSVEHNTEEENSDEEIDFSIDDEERVELNIYSMLVLSGSMDFYQRHAKDLPAEVQNSLQFLPPIRELRTPVLDALCDWISSGFSDFAKPISEVCNGGLAQSVALLCKAAAAQYVEALYQDCFLGRPLHTSSQSRLLFSPSTAADQSLLVGECVEDLAAKTAQRSQITRMSGEDISELKEALRLLRETQRLLAMRYEYGPLEAYRKATDTS
ncbi:MAG: hypothetical protein Q9221_002597 [Calogaya cf. arnoldii]